MVYDCNPIYRSHVEVLLFMPISEFAMYAILLNKEGQNVHMFELPAGHRVVDVVLFGLCCYARVRASDCVSVETQSVTAFFQETDPLYVTLPSPPPKEKPADAVV